MQKIYGSICESKCESDFDWSTFPLTAVIFDRFWPKGPLVNITFAQPQTRKNQRSFSSQQVPFHYPSFHKNFSSLSKHAKSRVVSHIRVEDIYKTYNQNIVSFTFGIWQRNLEHMWISLEDSFLDGICQNLSF